MPKNKSWFNFDCKAPDNPTIYIYGTIGAYDIGAKDFVKELNGIKAKEITLRMHSPGGNVFEGMSIFNAIEEHSATVKGQVDGMCGSICSVISMACDSLTMAKGSMMMIHRASGVSMGNSAEMRKIADVLDQIDGIQAKAYQAKTGMSLKDIREMMEKETYMNADKAKSLGFCDAVGNQNAIKAEVDFSCLGNVPDEIRAFFNGKEVEPATERELEQLLRDAGVSHSKAKAAISAMKADHRDDERVEGEKLRDYMQSELLKSILTR